MLVRTSSALHTQRLAELGLLFTNTTAQASEHRGREMGWCSHLVVLGIQVPVLLLQNAIFPNP
jgi:hypothetical protein